MYKVYNGNLLFHGCIPMEEDGSFAKVNIYGKEYSGKALFDILETYVRKAFFSRAAKSGVRTAARLYSPRCDTNFLII